MAKKLFIPKKCRVGFQHREETFTHQLAYVIYYDALGKIRKEPSWKGWCHLPGSKERIWNKDKKEHEELDGIEPFDFENVPTSGFVLNKGVRRYNWSHFGSGRSMIRIYDPRGVEFEITPDNLLGILLHTDCLRREIQGKLVYAWCGGDLMLLPCNSEEYEKARSYTELQTKKVGARELKEGATYITKGEDSLVYIGRHMWYEEKDRYRETHRRVGAKAHIFCALDGKSFKPIKSVPSTIAAVQNEHPHDETANWIDKYLASPQAAAVVGLEEVPLDPEEWNRDWDSHRRDRELVAYMLENGRYFKVCISKLPVQRGYGRQQSPLPPDTLIFSKHAAVHPDGFFESLNPSGYNYCVANHRDGVVTDRSRFFNLAAKYDNGYTQQWS